MSAQLRTFRAADSQSALAAVKAALGPDAILVSTRTVPGGLWRKAEIEVVAAAGEAYEAMATARQPSPSPSPSTAPPSTAPAEPSQSRLPAPGRSSAATAPSEPWPPRERAPVRGERGQGQGQASSSLGEGESGLPRIRPIDDPLASEVQLLRRSVEEARRALASVTREARAGRELQMAPAAAELYARLVGRGVEPVLAEEMVRQAMALAAAPRAGGLEGAVRDLIGERLLPCRAPWLHAGRHVIALVGPTGVGKTTTVAKIAARALLEAKKRVALLTVDTYRIGACDQLARYGEIMGVPVLVARDRAELARAHERVKEADLVLIDTAGRSSAEDVARQAELVRAIPKVQLHLVVSAATGSLELAAVAERWRSLAPDRLVFSKLDEAAGPGSILSAAVRIGRPVSCIADGQRVPEDLHALTGPQLVDVVLPGATAVSDKE